MADLPGEDGRLILAALGAAIRDHRIQAGMTQTELAESAGIKRGHIYSIETGKKSATVLLLVRLARSLGVTPGDLLQPVPLNRAAR